MSIFIRHVDLNQDLDQVRNGILDFIARMDYHDFLPETSHGIVAGLERLLNLPEVEILVAEHNGRLVGGIGMIYAPCLWNLGLLNAEELFWWVSEDAPSSTALRLLRSVQAEAKKRGCKMISMKSLTSSPETIDKVYRKMGLRPVDKTYIGAV